MRPRAFRLGLVVFVACVTPSVLHVRDAAGQSPSPLDDADPARCQIEAPDTCESECQAGSDDACVLLARLLLSGETGESDDARAYSLLSASCSRGHAVGCGALGELYLAGRGVERDVERGQALLRGSCADGDGLSCESLGGLYSGFAPELTALIPRNLSAAAEWWERACSLGVISACVSFAALLADGAGVEPDPGRAVGLLARGCSADIPVACTLLGDMFDAGEGVEADPSKAALFHERACDLGYERACNR